MVAVALYKTDGSCVMKKYREKNTKQFLKQENRVRYYLNSIIFNILFFKFNLLP